MAGDFHRNWMVKYFRIERTPFDRFAAASPASGGRKAASSKHNILPPPFTGEVSRRDGGGAAPSSGIYSNQLINNQGTI